MDMINFILASAAAYSGLIAGFIIAKLTKEELEPGKRYFSMLMAILLALMTGLTLSYYSLNIFLTIIAAITMLIAALKLDLKRLDIIIYPLFALLLALLSKNISYFITAAAIVFIYSLPAAAEKNNFIRTVSFIPLTIVFYFFTI
ncbi:hypothetical protein GF336_00675 [Candidatus Woesearchaeota archaeon]|nr:hypothetical protein [Candidatus Woesearchaeota archaeon]